MSNRVLPKPFYKKGFSFLDEIGETGCVKSPGRGQEFTGEADKKMMSWDRKIINPNT